MSSLAAQLKRIAVPSLVAAQVDVAASAKSASAARATGRASILYDARKAAETENALVYATGVNGMAELIQLSPDTFSTQDQAYQLLFGPAAPSCDRTLQTAEENARLDEHIDRFLRDLSPFVMLKPAQKALEWLVRRFRINEYNMDELVAAVLPYHDTHLFARVAAILPLRQTAAIDSVRARAAPGSTAADASQRMDWTWLRAVQKSAHSIDRPTLVQRCLADPALYRFIATTVHRAIAHAAASQAPKALISFYAATTIAMIESCPKITDDFVLLVAPFIRDALKSRLHPEFRIAAIMTATQLAVATPLSPALISAFVTGVAQAPLLKNTSAVARIALVSSALPALVILQSQSRAASLAPAVVAALALYDSAEAQLVALASTHDLTAFLQALLAGALAVLTSVQDDTSSARDEANDMDAGDATAVSAQRANRVVRLIAALVAQVELADSDVSLIVQRVLEALVSARRAHQPTLPSTTKSKKQLATAQPSEAHMSEQERHFASILVAFERKHPDVVDTAISRLLAAATTPSDKQWLAQLVSTSFSATARRQIVLDGAGTLFLSLESPNPEIRLAAVEQLATLTLAAKRTHAPPLTILDDDSDSRDDAFIARSLLARLGDDNLAIAHRVLELGSGLVNAVPQQPLLGSLARLLSKVASASCKSSDAQSAQRSSELVFGVLLGGLLPAAPESLIATLTMALPFSIATACSVSVLLGLLRAVHTHIKELRLVDALFVELDAIAADLSADIAALSSATLATLASSAEHAQRRSQLSSRVCRAFAAVASASSPASAVSATPRSAKKGASPTSSSLLDQKTLAELCVQLVAGGQATMDACALARALSTETLPAFLQRAVAAVGVLVALVEASGDSSATHAAMLRITELLLTPDLWLAVHGAPGASGRHTQSGLAVSDVFGAALALLDSGKRLELSTAPGSQLPALVDALDHLLSGALQHSSEEAFVRTVFQLLASNPAPINLFHRTMRALVGQHLASPMSFLTSTWTTDLFASASSQSNALLQVRALHVMRAFIETAASSTQQSAACDFQAYLPHLLVALSSAERIVRAAAMQCLRVLDERAAAARELKFWRMYEAESSSQLRHFLTAEQYVATLAQLLAQREEFVNDPSHVLAFVASCVQLDLVESASLRDVRSSSKGSSSKRPAAGSSGDSATGPLILAYVLERAVNVFDLTSLAGVASTSLLIKSVASVEHPQKAVMLAPLLVRVVQEAGRLLPDAAALRHALEQLASLILSSSFGVPFGAAAQLWDANVAVAVETTSDVPRLVATSALAAWNKGQTDSPSIAFFIALCCPLVAVKAAALQQLIARSMYASMPTTCQRLILTIALDAIVSSGSDLVGDSAKQFIRELPISASLFANELEALGAVRQQSSSQVVAPSPAPAVQSSNKRARTDEDGSRAPLTGAPSVLVVLHRVTAAVESLQFKSVAKPQRLVQPLFDLLEESMTLEMLDHMSLEYLKQLVLGALSKITLDVLASAKPSAAQDDMEVDVDGEEDDADEDPRASALSLQLRNQPLHPSGLHAKLFRVDLVVQCIRTTSNPQTQHQALQLLAAVARPHPQLVLQDIMPLFTFMSANVVRQDDSQSFQILQQTLEAVIPPLVDSTSSSTAISVIKVFVGAVTHIPDHRRLRLFTQLVATLGERYLAAVCLLLLDQRSSTNTALSTATPGGNAAVATASPASGMPPPSPLLFSPSIANLSTRDTFEFAQTLLQQFDCAAQLDALAEMLETATTLPFEVSSTGSNGSSAPAAAPKAGKGSKQSARQSAAVETHSAMLAELVCVRSSRQLRIFKQAVVSTAASLLASKPFLGRLAQLQAQNKNALQDQFMHSVDAVLKFATQLGSHMQELHSGEQAGKPSSASLSLKFWKAVLGAAYDLLDTIVALLPVASFVAAARGLLTHKDANVRRKTLQIFNERVSFKMDNADVAIFVGTAGHLVELVSTVKNNKGSLADDAAAIPQTALLCLDSLAKRFARSHPDSFLSAIPAVLEAASTAPPAGASGKQKAAQLSLSASAFVCVATFVSELGVRMMPHVNQIMGLVLDRLRLVLDTVSSSLSHTDSAPTLLVLSCLGVLQSALGSLAQFLSPFMGKLIAVLSHAKLESAAVASAAAPGLAASGTPAGVARTCNRIVMKVEELVKIMPATVPTRILLPALLAAGQQPMTLTSASPATVLSHGHAFAAVCRMLSIALPGIPRDELHAQIKPLSRFFLTAFNWRALVQPATSADAVAHHQLVIAEDSLIQAFASLALKLSESQFRPVLVQVVEWALVTPAAVTLAVVARRITLYRLMTALSERLRNLFTPFFGLVWTDLVKVLDNQLFASQELRSDRAASELLDAALVALHKCFLFDSDKFVDKERFNAIVPPLAAQIGCRVGGAQSHRERVSSILVPCIGQLAVTVADDSLWKLLNHQVMSYSRDTSPAVRFAALKVQQEFYARLGDEFLILVPETIPYLAELMEDENVEVEKLAQEVIATIESHLGESLQQYF
ncbi:BP28CT domain-containing protein [Capsaspora owczarzaki ATCC 30864]|uniref:HEAT repeat-containing protein 1 n=1 Tax=Capsaspora owczarzaki (strain ATCC 30864) TaxID=595528 RepID=A0A0D2UP84_CAPO3|nr:BP28CT domain-containing protein [Capsaspora owczarzaki ATCC 30864]KJE96811.1 BP28CT domain-containing protein [Capsaspora owczarzaki ATCC 30864]|eukprot:XP_004343801.1 BP28CT domain-containing protein [Capsaspora owczarzaki ATCC 30864]